MSDIMSGYAFFEGRPKDNRFLKSVNAVRKELQFDSIMECLSQLKIPNIRRTKVRFFFWGGYTSGQVLRV